MALRTLRGLEPVEADTLRAAVRAATVQQREAIVRLWITETIPVAFDGYPLAFEAFRLALAEGLELHPKHVGLTGSSRLGFSARPDSWGRCLGPDSDLDVFVVSDSLFQEIVEDQKAWLAQEHKDLIREEKYANYLRKMQRRGFADGKHVPKWEGGKALRRIIASVRAAYATFERIGWQPIAQAHRRKKKRFLGRNLRVYQNWPAAIRQLERSLNAGAKAT